MEEWIMFSHKQLDTYLLFVCMLHVLNRYILNTFVHMRQDKPKHNAATFYCWDEIVLDTCIAGTEHKSNTCATISSKINSLQLWKILSSSAKLIWIGSTAVDLPSTRTCLGLFTSLKLLLAVSHTTHLLYFFSSFCSRVMNPLIHGRLTFLYVS